MEIISICISVALIVFYGFSAVYQKSLITVLEKKLEERNRMLYVAHKYCLTKIIQDAIKSENYEVAAQCQQHLNFLEKNQY